MTTLISSAPTSSSSVGSANPRTSPQSQSAPIPIAQRAIQNGSERLRMAKLNNRLSHALPKVTVRIAALGAILEENQEYSPAGHSPSSEENSLTRAESGSDSDTPSESSVGSFNSVAESPDFDVNPFDGAEPESGPDTPQHPAARPSTVAVPKPAVLPHSLTPAASSPATPISDPSFPAAIVSLEAQRSEASPQPKALPKSVREVLPRPLPDDPFADPEGTPAPIIDIDGNYESEDGGIFNSHALDKPLYTTERNEVLQAHTEAVELKKAHKKTEDGLKNIFGNAFGSVLIFFYRMFTTEVDFITFQGERYYCLRDKTTELKKMLANIPAPVEPHPYAEVDASKLVKIEHNSPQMPKIAGQGPGSTG